jgi:hypothetical protein
MGVLAFVFAAQMINFAIPATGSSDTSAAGCCWRSCSGLTRRSSSSLRY